MQQPIEPLFAFGFGNLIMLGWLAAAAAPILIHLWSRRKHREVRWAAIDFLLAAMKRNARRIQLQQWLLLAVRTLIILLIVLAVSEPYWEQFGKSFIAGRRTHKVLVLDGSYSMAYLPTDRSRFSRAKQLATQIVEESPQGDGFTLILMSSPPQVIVQVPAFEPQYFTDEIEALQLPHTGGDLSATLAKVEEVLETARQEHKGLENHEVYFLTDLGRTTWAASPGSESQQSTLQKQVEKLRRQASLKVLDLGQSSFENLAITDVKSIDSFSTVWQDITIEAQVHNFGSQLYSDHTIDLLIDNVRTAEQTIDVRPGEQVTVSFTFRTEKPGLHVAEVKLGSDLLDVDNQRWLSLPVRKHLRALCVSGKQGSTKYLAYALDPDQSDRSLIKATVVSESALTELNLEEFDCIFLCNIEQFTAGEAARMATYLQRGGGLIFFLGDRVQPDRYNRELTGQRKGSQPILPVKLDAVAPESQYRFNPLDYKHPIVSPFRGRVRAGLLSTPVYRYMRMSVPSPAQADSARVALAFENGDPAIVDQPLYGGHVIVVALPASLASIDATTRTPWTTMPAWPSFLPIVRELVARTVQSDGKRLNLQVGDALGDILPASASGAALEIERPNKKKQPLQAVSQLDGTHWSFDNTLQSGIYALHLNGSLPEAPANGQTADGLLGQKFAVNVNTVESDLTKADHTELPQGFEVMTDWQNEDSTAQLDIERHDGLPIYLLYAAFVLLLVELYLAWSFGRGIA